VTRPEEEPDAQQLVVDRRCNAAAVLNLQKWTQ
jgi:hypothetical protein